MKTVQRTQKYAHERANSDHIWEELHLGQSSICADFAPRGPLAMYGRFFEYYNVGGQVMVAGQLVSKDQGY